MYFAHLSEDFTKYSEKKEIEEQVEEQNEVGRDFIKHGILCAKNGIKGFGNLHIPGVLNPVLF